MRPAPPLKNERCCCCCCCRCVVVLWSNTVIPSQNELPAVDRKLKMKMQFSRLSSFEHCGEQNQSSRMYFCCCCSMFTSSGLCVDRE